MPVSKRLLNNSILLSSIILISLSITSFAVAGHAFKTIATEFPADQYIWKDSSNVGLVGYWTVTLAYDWTAENLVWVTSGLSIMTGILGLYVPFTSMRRGKDQPTSTSTPWPFTLAPILATAAFLTTLISFIYVTMRKADMDRLGGSCAWYAGYNFDQVFVCSRELAACNIIEHLSEQAPDARRQACRETTTARLMMVPLFLFSFVLAGCYTVQMYGSRKENGRLVADQRVEALQREEE